MIDKCHCTEDVPSSTEQMMNSDLASRQQVAKTNTYPEEIDHQALQLGYNNVYRSIVVVKTTSTSFKHQLCSIQCMCLFII